MKYHWWLKQEKFISSQFGGYKSKIKVFSGLVPTEASLLAVDGHRFLPVYVLIYSYKDTISSHVGLEPTHMTSFYLNNLLKALAPNTVTF